MKHYFLYRMVKKTLKTKQKILFFFKNQSFGLDVPFPKKFRDTVKNIFKRLFRIYAHIYYSHAQEIVELGVEAHLNTAFKHFYLFIREFDLVEPKEMAPLQHLIDNILGQLKEKDGKEDNKNDVEKDEE